MELKTPDDWWELAEKTLPRLPEYAHDNRSDWDEDLADKLLEERNWSKLHHLLNALWEDLPDHPGIRVQPFFDLCDLCSEVWVFDESDSE